MFKSNMLTLYLEYRCDDTSRSKVKLIQLAVSASFEAQVLVALLCFDTVVLVLILSLVFSTKITGDIKRLLIN
ncbi:hypothetical protein APR43_03810 [Flavobacterium sp. NLM]|nr:hypothetical protein APR43_03810 [Flavobacterium sp. NLM]